MPDLLTRFSSSEGYRLYPDVLPFFRSLREATGYLHTYRSDIKIGVLTNSDDRVPQILSSLGLSVGPWRYGTGLSNQQRPSGNYHDIDFVALSYDIGFSKPDPQIFEATKKMAQQATKDSLECLHVGDDLEKDYKAAQVAGWRSVLLDREREYKDRGVPCISELSELGQHLTY